MQLDSGRCRLLRREQLGTLERRSFIVVRRFDTAADGQGMYEAVDPAAYRRVVLVGREDDVPTAQLGQRVSVYVRDRGEQPFTVTTRTAYGVRDYTEYYTRYDVAEDGAEVERLQHEVARLIEEVRRDLQWARDERDRRLSAARAAFGSEAKPHIVALQAR